MIFSLFFKLLLAAASAQAPATLKQAYELALRHSESIAASEQSIKEAEALYRRALGGAGPELSFRTAADWEDEQGSRLSPSSQSGLRLAKTDLTGYRELAAVRAAKADENRKGQLRRRAEQLLLGDVAGAFFGLLQARENVDATKRLIELADQRRTELRERVRVGRNREADVVGQDFQAAALRSQLEESTRQAEARTDLLSYLVHGPFGEPTAPAPAPTAARPLEDYLARVETRPDLRAAAEGVREADQLVRSEQAGRLPRVGAQANLYSHRPASLKDNRWDASLTLGLPLWSWGEVTASVDAARARAGRQELELQSLRRLAQLEVRNAYRDLASARRQLELRRQAVELAEKDHDLQDRDEKRGLVPALEGLESLHRLNGARLSYNNALLAVRLASINLDVASGAEGGEVELLK